MPPAYVRPYVKRGKTDAGDAEAICEAVSRPTMRFVPVKAADQQGAAMVLKTRDLLVRQRNQAINALRGHLSELGIVAGVGVSRVTDLIAVVRDEADERLPRAARWALADLADQIEALTARLARLDREIVSQGRRFAAADDGSRHWPDLGGFAQGPRSRSHRVCLRATLCGLARVDATTAFKRRQGASGSDLEDGQSDAAHPAHPRGHNRPAARAQRGQSLGLGGGNLGAQAAQGGRCGAGQQDGAHCLGLVGEGRHLSRTRSPSGKRHGRLTRVTNQS
jgi:hypothetical protein